MPAKKVVNTESISMNERILSLIFAFTFLRREVTGEELREIIPAYRTAPSFDAWERMFSRDKRVLKENGYALKSVKNGYSVYYSLETRSLDLDIELDSTEAEYICEIAGIWDDRFALKTLRTALSKSGQLHLCNSEHHICATAGQNPARIKSISPFASVLLDLMILKTHCIEIFYQKHGSTSGPGLYVVIPLQFTYYAENWYLCAIDIEQMTIKTFRADRIKDIGATFEVSANLPEGFSFDDYFDYIDVVKTAQEGDLVE